MPPVTTIAAAHSSLHRVNLLTRTQFAFTSAWKKKLPSVQPAPPDVVEAASASIAAAANVPSVAPPLIDLPQPMESQDSFEGSSSSPLRLKLRRENSGESDLNSLHSGVGGGGGSGIPTSRLSAIMLAAKLRKLSVRTSVGRLGQSKILLKAFSPTDPILAIRPLTEVSYCCIVHREWFLAWKRYIQSGLFEDIEYPITDPGPISNHLLLRKSSRTTGPDFGPGLGTEIGIGEESEAEVVLNHQLRIELHLNQDYFVLSPNVWKILFEIYGGGPAIYREDTNIYGTEYDSNGQPCRRRRHKNNNNSL
jgi:hypothetical protein